MKSCKNCKWAKKDWLSLSQFTKCISPQNPKVIDKVTGEEKFKVKFCSSHREFNSSELCGPDGKWFEPKT
jgi:hypothetical protein